PELTAAELQKVVAATGYGKDPDLLKQFTPGELWPLTLDDRQRRIATALCDLIVPAEGEWPAASSVGVVAFIDEWISAPYPQMSQDRPLILDGLAWLDAESKRRFDKDFADALEIQKQKICDDICPGPNA